MQDRLIFLIGSPRSGSTLLSRVLGAHSKIYAPEEPHLITPIAHLGFYDSVDSAAYDPVITRQAARALVAALPGGESEYLDALRAYTDAIYRGLFESQTACFSSNATSDTADTPDTPDTCDIPAARDKPSSIALSQAPNRSYLLDKTPAYALSLDFLVRLYPEARYLVLTRNPIAVWSSFVDSFFDGDDRAAHAHNPLLERYVPAIARFLQTSPVPFHHAGYEKLVQSPDEEARKICDFLEIDFEPEMVDYGSTPGARGESTRGLGDPIGVARQSRPTTQSLSKWVTAATGKPERVGLYREILARLSDEDLESWSTSRSELSREIDGIDLAGRPAPRPRLTRYALERRLLVSVRRRIQPENGLGRLVKRIREVCDVLLR
jgi:hypothetical protein